MKSPNENRPGYRKTKVGWIPEDWECLPFTSLFDRVSVPVDVDPKGTYREIGIRSHCKGVFFKEKTTGKALGNKRVFWCQPGALTFNIVFAWEQAIAILGPETEGLIASHRFPMYKAKNGRGSEAFYLWFFRSLRGKHGLGLASPGGAGRNKTLGQGELDYLFVPSPTLPEQEHIAELLCAWDRKIEQLDRLIATKESRKRGLMQQLLTGNRRFPGFRAERKEEREAKRAKNDFPSDWKVYPLKRVCSISYGKEWSKVAVESGSYSVYGTGGVIGKSSSPLDKGPAILIGRKGTIDSPILIREPFWAVDTTFYAKAGEKADTVFLYYSLSNVCWKRYSETSGIPSLSRSTINNLRFGFPTLHEQRRIAAVLNACDAELEQLRAQLAALKQQKKGLMQKLLTGEVRIPAKERAKNVS